jgi:hypothetical protein
MPIPSDEEFEFKLGQRAATQGIQQDGFFDPNGTFPRREYSGGQVTNRAARGIDENRLLLGGGHEKLDLEIDDLPASEYTKNQVRETISGHVTEIDDTDGRNRILIKHSSGAGIDMLPDGSIIINSRRNTIRISAGDEKVIIEGDGEIVYNGNLRLNVAGNFDLKVGGDYNVEVGGDHVEDIKGAYRQDINKNFQSFINRNMSQQITGNKTEFIYGSLEEMVKANHSRLIQGTSDTNVKGRLEQTSQEEAVLTAPSINIDAKSLLVAGDSGTIGGENIIMYNYNMYTGHSITAGDTISTNTANITEVTTCKEFVGSLTGNADQATQSGISGGPGGSAGTKVTGTAKSVDTKATVLPTNTIMNSLIHEGEHACKVVNLDPGNILFNSINRLADYGGVSDRTLNIDEIRSKLRETINQVNEAFIGAVVSEGTLSPNYGNGTPDEVKRIVKNDATPRYVRSKLVIGKSLGAEAKRFKGKVQNVTEVLSVDPQYDPRLFDITEHTELQKGVRIARFLGSRGDRTNFDKIGTNAERQEIAKHLVPHANLLREFMDDDDLFEDYRLVVAESVTTEPVIIEGGMTDLKAKGRAVVYELYGPDGNIAHEKTFDLAVWWKDSLKFEKMILDYDTYDFQTGALNTQLIIIMPEFEPGGYKTSYLNEIETRYNNVVQSTNELVECI